MYPPPPSYQDVPSNDEDDMYSAIPKKSKAFKKIKKYAKQFTKIIGKIVTSSYKHVGAPLSICIIIMIVNMVAFFYVEKMAYNIDLQNWLNHREQCQCKFDNNVKETIYCVYLTTTRRIPDDIDDTYHIIGTNRTCYVDYTVKKIISIQYYIPKYQFLSFNGEDNKPGLFTWLMLSIAFFLSALFCIIDDNIRSGNY